MLGKARGERVDNRARVVSEAGHIEDCPFGVVSDSHDWGMILIICGQVNNRGVCGNESQGIDCWRCQDAKTARLR